MVADTRRCLRELVPSVEHRLDADLQRIAEAVTTICLAPNPGSAMSSVLPLAIGRSAHLGHEVVMRYDSGPGCVAVPNVVIVYDDVDGPTCCAQKQGLGVVCEAPQRCLYDRCSPTFAGPDAATSADHCSAMREAGGRPWSDPSFARRMAMRASQGGATP